MQTIKLHKSALAATAIMIWGVPSLLGQTSSAEWKGPDFAPNESVTLEITFTGTGANDIKSVQAFLANKSDSTPEGQVGFQTNWYTLYSETKLGPHAFSLTFKIPENAATGQYNVTIIAKPPAGEFRYDPNATKVELHITNSKHYERPNIDVKLVPNEP